jgi:hypothetical protein
LYFRVAVPREEPECALESAGIRLGLGYSGAIQKINVELIVFADDAEAVIAELNAALNQLEERHTLFGGGMETVAQSSDDAEIDYALGCDICGAVSLVAPSASRSSLWSRYSILRSRVSRTNRRAIIA